MRRRFLKQASKTSRLHCLVRRPRLQATLRLPRVPHLAPGARHRAVAQPGALPSRVSLQQEPMIPCRAPQGGERADVCATAAQTPPLCVSGLSRHRTSEGVVLQQVELGSGQRTQLANPSLLADTELLRQAKASVRGTSALGQSARRRLPGAATRQSQHPPWASCIAEMAPCYALT